mmetsp:Transcript_63897/g.172476  ORF Transcript_63897/g.172476 Transcript_63897/m.172476 type:complete len:310 (-) Transcript_63897:278-1207(-)
MPWAASTRSRSAPAPRSQVPTSSGFVDPSSKSNTAFTCPIPHTTSRSPSSRATTALQAENACGLFSSSASSSRSTFFSASCSSRVCHVWILAARAGMSLVWKFFAHQSAASGLRSPWKSAKADAGVSTKLSGNFSANLAILGSSFNSTVRSILAPRRTALAPAARATTGKSELVCGVSTSRKLPSLTGSSMRYCPIREPSCEKYTPLRGSRSSSSLKRTQPSPGGMSFSCFWPDFALGSTSRLSMQLSTPSRADHCFRSNRWATRFTPVSPSSWKARSNTSLSLTAACFSSRLGPDTETSRWVGLDSMA